MGASRPHVTIVGDHAEEGTKLLDISRRFHAKNCVDLLAPRFDAIRSQPVTEKISLLDTPLAFKRVDRETFILQNCKYLFE